MIYGLALFFLVFGLGGCAIQPVFPDISAGDNGDPTLVMSGCEGNPSKGLEVCRFLEGAGVDSGLFIMLPWSSNTTEATVKIRYKDRLRTYIANGRVVKVSWFDITGQYTWAKETEALVQITATTTEEIMGDKRITRLLGFVYPVVTPLGYSPLPLSSHEPYKATSCQVKYGVGGNSAILCK